MEGLLHNPSAARSRSPRREAPRPGHLFDPRGATLTSEGALVTPPRPGLDEHRSDIIIPALQETMPEELRGKVSVASRRGLLYVPEGKGEKGIEIDISRVPKELRAEKKFEYLDFTEKEIEVVLQAHDRYAKNLFSGDPRQQGIYVGRLLEAAGFRAENKEGNNTAAFVRGVVEVVAQECAQNRAQKPCFAREDFLANWLATKEQISHPLPEQEQEDAHEKHGRKMYHEDAPYRQLSLLFMPKIWNSMNQEERLLLLDSVVTLYEYTANPAAIDSPELFLRLTQILAQEQDVGARSLIYLLFDAVPYTIVPQEAKNALARAIVARKEFQAPIAIALLTDPGDKTGAKNPDILRLRQKYIAFRQEVLGRLAQPAETLAAMPFPQWMKLVQDVEHLSLLSITDDKEEADTLAQEKFGIELELSPYELVAKEHNGHHTIDDLAGDASKELIQLDLKKGLQSAGRDQGCVEVRTMGAVPVDAEAFCALRETARTVEHAVPSDVVTYHLHVEAEKDKKGFSDFFRESKHNTHGKGTLELRSFRPPTLLLAQQRLVKSRTNQVDVVAIERSVLFGVLSGDISSFPTKPSYPTELQNFPPREAVRKILAVSLFGSDPRQRAAVIQLMNRPPLFLKESIVRNALFSHVPIDQACTYRHAAGQMVYERDQENFLLAFDEKISFQRKDIDAYRESGGSWSESMRSVFWSHANKSILELSQEDALVLLDIVVDEKKEGWTVYVARQLPNAPSARVSHWLSYLKQQGDEIYDWQVRWEANQLAEVYPRIRAQLSGEQRSFFYRLIVKLALTDPALTAVLREDIADADEETRMRFHLRFLETESVADVKQAVRYATEHTYEMHPILMRLVYCHDSEKRHIAFECLSLEIYVGDRSEIIQELLRLEPDFIRETLDSSRGAVTFTLKEETLAVVLNQLPPYSPEWQESLDQHLRDIYPDGRLEPHLFKKLMHAGYHELVDRRVQSLLEKDFLMSSEDEAISEYSAEQRRDSTLDLVFDLAATMAHAPSRRFVVDHLPECTSAQRLRLFYQLVQPQYTDGDYNNEMLEEDNRILFRDCLLRETDPVIIDEAMVQANRHLFLSSDGDFETWSDFIRKHLSEFSQEVREQLFTSLVERKNPIVLDLLEEFFPYGALWSDKFMKTIVEDIAKHLGSDGEDFLIDLYDHSPPPILKRAIEQAIPKLLAWVNANRAKDWKRRALENIST